MATSQISDCTCYNCDKPVNPDTAWYGQVNRFECGFRCTDCDYYVTVIIDTDLPED